MSYITGNIGKQYLTADPDNMQVPWGADFTSEVAANNFIIGGKCLLLLGPNAETAAQQWVACLNRISMPAYRTTAMEIVRRLEGKVIPRDDPQRVEEFERAETLFVFDFFVPSELDNDLLYWFIREALRDGIVLVLVSEDDDADLDCHGANIGRLVEKHFEVIKHGSQTSTKKAPTIKGRNRKHGGPSTAGGDNN